MRKHQVAASALIKAPPERVYDIIADYRNDHPHIVPRPPFGDLIVEEGGVGAGTVVRFGMRVMGRLRTFRAAITEPEPGRVLVETDLDRGAATTFTVEPIELGRRSQVTISTSLNIRSGPLGWLERLIVTRFLRRIYVRELRLLAKVAEAEPPSPQR